MLLWLAWLAWPGSASGGTRIQVCGFSWFLLPAPPWPEPFSLGCKVSRSDVASHFSSSSASSSVPEAWPTCSVRSLGSPRSLPCAAPGQGRGACRAAGGKTGAQPHPPIRGMGATTEQCEATGEGKEEPTEPRGVGLRHFPGGTRGGSAPWLTAGQPCDSSAPRSLSLLIWKRGQNGSRLLGVMRG